MRKSVVTAVLIWAQLAAWNASPLYLCIADDGSVCLDSGPGTCDCCSDEDHAEAPHTAIGSSRHDCDCLHVQLTAGSLSAAVSREKLVRTAVIDATVVAAIDARCDQALVLGSGPTSLLMPSAVLLTGNASGRFILRC